MRKTLGRGVIFSLLLVLFQVLFAQDFADYDGWFSKTTVPHPQINPRTTYERFLPLAEAGDPDIQNLLGFMYFYSEGVGLDYDQAHHWFHEAAEQGNLMAQRNLGLLHSKSRPRIPDAYFDPVEANFWFSLYAAGTPGESRLAANSYEAFLSPVSKEQSKPLDEREVGKEVYVTFCAGCHGFEDHAAYPSSPSLLLGERLQQPDSVLLISILDGKNNMPAWRDTLSDEQAREALYYIRTRFGTRQDKPINLTKDPHPPAIQSDSNPKDFGEITYTKFCGGCHGFNGISYYVNSPSFALRERMQKSDFELSESISRGRGVMPGWENMLTSIEIDSLVRFIRTLAPAYESGIDHNLRVAPDLYFLFQPYGEDNDDWHVREDQ